MGYEYDFVFDWMVKKANPNPQIKSEEERKDDGNDNNGQNDIGAAQ